MGHHCGFLFLLYSFNIVLGQAPKPPKKTPELLSQGKKLYEQNCATCHGPKAMGRANLELSLSLLPRTSPSP